jgi:hypothetical protein
MVCEPVLCASSHEAIEWQAGFLTLEIYKYILSTGSSCTSTSKALLWNYACLLSAEETGNQESDEVECAWCYLH